MTTPVLLSLAFACPALAGSALSTQAASAQAGAGRQAGTHAIAPALPGTFPADWVHGSSDCVSLPEPPIQVHAYKDDTYILRQSMCLNYEGPFLYLLLGQQKALLIDTGATSSALTFPLQVTVQQILDTYEAQQGLPDLDLIVAHSHGHGDHKQADPQFVGKPNTTVVGTSLAAVQAFFGIASWPDQLVEYDLGGRVLDIIPTPGHQSAHIVFYDRRQDLLFTGDTLYPGFLFIGDQAAYRLSVDRLAAFAQLHPINFVLGGHVEMTATPGVAYPYGTAYQPLERVPQLSPAHLFELQAALQAMVGPIVQEVHDDFIIKP